MSRGLDQKLAEFDQHATRTNNFTVEEVQAVDGRLFYGGKVF